MKAIRPGSEGLRSRSLVRIRRRVLTALAMLQARNRSWRRPAAANPKERTATDTSLHPDVLEAGMTSNIEPKRRFRCGCWNAPLRPCCRRYQRSGHLNEVRMFAVSSDTF